MTQNTGTTVIAPIVTPDSNDKFPTHINSMGKGGYHAVMDIAARDAIPMERREEGMLVGVVVPDSTVYQLKGGIDNAFWTIFTTGAGGATSASDMIYTPTGALTGTNVQSGIDELESKKADRVTTYSKTEVDNKITNHTHDYNTLQNLPNLSQLHDHTNKATLDLFSQLLGELTWNGKTVGTMVADIYDIDKDGIIDKAKTLEGLLVTINALNMLQGATSNIQDQINALVNGVGFGGEFPTYADAMTAIPSPTQGTLIYIQADENKNGSRTQYIYNSGTWVYGGGASVVSKATDTVTGGIKLAGVLANPLGSSDNPLLTPTGVTPGTYNAANVTVSEDGRVSYIEEGNTAFISDATISLAETWSSEKINDELSTKATLNHTHSQLHDANMIGNIPVDTSTVSDKRVMTYNAVNSKVEFQDAAGGKVYVGSKVISGDYRLVAGTYVNLFIDDVAKTITINNTATGSGGGSVPSLTEITHTDLIPAGQSISLSLDAAFTKYDIRAVEVWNSENNLIDIEIFNSSAQTRSIYLSNKQIHVDDIVNRSCHDKDESQKLHCKITNYGSTDTTISLIIETTNLL